MTRKHSKAAAVQAMADAIERTLAWGCTEATQRLSCEAAAGGALRALRRFARVEMRELPKRKQAKRKRTKESTR